jgi:hypothetical protein
MSAPKRARTEGAEDTIDVTSILEQAAEEQTELEKVCTPFCACSLACFHRGLTRLACVAERSLLNGVDTADP